MRNSPWLPKRKTALRKTAIKRKPRSAKQFARIYGSPERAAWITSMPCMWAGAGLGPCLGETVQAHVRSDGHGRKADARWIVPMCSLGHHPQFDQYTPPFNRGNWAREAAYRYAAQVEQCWQQYHGAQYVQFRVRDVPFSTDPSREEPRA